MYASIRGRLPIKLLALFNIWNRHSDTICHLAGVQFMGMINSGCLWDIDGVLTVHQGNDVQEITSVDIGTILGRAPLMSETAQHSLINTPIDIRRFKETN